jgi:brefeldin A-resistance guanine nucleotide exchange factor 1
LISQLPEGGPALIVVKPEVPTSGFANGQRPQAKGPIYDPTIIYLLELATVLALRDSNTVAELGKDVAEALQGVVRDAANLHPTVASRSAFYLLSLLKASHVRSLNVPYSELSINMF